MATDLSTSDSSSRPVVPPYRGSEEESVIPGRWSNRREERFTSTSLAATDRHWRSRSSPAIAVSSTEEKEARLRGSDSGSDLGRGSDRVPARPQGQRALVSLRLPTIGRSSQIQGRRFLEGLQTKFAWHFPDLSS